MPKSRASRLEKVGPEGFGPSTARFPRFTYEPDALTWLSYGPMGSWIPPNLSFPLLFDDFTIFENYNTIGCPGNFWVVGDDDKCLLKFSIEVTH
jgi:hypothetical protein